MKYIITVIITILLFGCSNGKNKGLSDSENNGDTVRSDNLIKPIEIFIKEPIDPARMTILNGYLFVSCFKCTPMVYTFSIPELEIRNSFGIKGQGPDEFNFAIFGAGSDKDLYMWGYSSLKQINQYKVQDNGEVMLHNKVNMNKLLILNNFHLVKDSFIFYNDIQESLAIKKVDLYNSDRIESVNFERSQKASCFDENFGNLAASSHGIAYLYQYKDRIDFFDLNLNLKKTVENVQNKSSINSTPQGFEGNVVYHTTAYYSGQKSLYVIYKGFSLLDKRNSTSNIREYDWEGNVIAEYHLDAAITLFAVDETSKKLIGYHPARPDVFLCFDLK